MKRAIAGARGSVRGAPPEVYAGFMSIEADDPAEQMKPAFIFFKTVLFIIPGIIIAVWFFWTTLGAIFFEETT